jgi:ribosome recycling factor
MGQDEQRGHSEKIQELTDRLVKEVDATLATKEAEIQKV